MFIVVDVQTSLINSTFGQSPVCCVSVVPLIHHLDIIISHILLVVAVITYCEHVVCIVMLNYLLRIEWLRKL